MIAVVAPPGEMRDALVARLDASTRVVEPGDPVAASDAVAAAEMALVYHCVALHPVEALMGSALRSTVLVDDPAAAFDPAELAERAARALLDDPPA